MDKIIGIGEYAISNHKDDILKTFALASCVALCVYCPIKNASGMVHIALPVPNHVSDNCNQRPGYYAITAVPFLIKKMCDEFSCQKSDLNVRLFGGADSLQVNDVFEIGKKNILYIQNLLHKIGILYDASETGGNCIRTLEMDVYTGKIKLFVQQAVI